MVVGADGLIWVFQKLLIYWDFHPQPSLGFTENGPKQWKYPVQFTQAHQNWTKDWKNITWSDESWFLLPHSDVGSEFGVKNMKAWIILPCLNGSGWWWCNGVGDVVLAHFGPLSTNWASFKHQSTWVLLLTIIPLWLQCTIFWCTSSRIMHSVTKLKSSQTGFLNMTMSSLYSNGLHSPQISI